MGADVALTGSCAERRLKSERFAGVLLDLNLPDQRGVDVLRVIRNRGDLTPVVVLTGAGTIPAVVEAMKLGVLELLEKPVRLAQLETVVQLLAFTAAQRPSGQDQPVDRLVIAVMTVVRNGVDVATVREWAALIGRSESSLYALCEAAGVPAKAVLDLARLLRVNRSFKFDDRFDGLSSADPRTVHRLLQRAGLTEVAVQRHSASELLARQKLMTDAALLRRIASANV